MLNYPGDIDLSPEFAEKLCRSKNPWLNLLGVTLTILHMVWLVFLMCMMGVVFWVIGQVLR